jgi:hypothetical protein
LPVTTPNSYNCVEFRNHMSPLTIDSQEWTAENLLPFLSGNAPLFPELEAVRADPAALLSAPQTQRVLAETQPWMQDLANIPLTRYTAFRRFVNDGDRVEYQTPYFAKRQKLAAAALRMWLGIDGGLSLKPVVEDYLWNICEETTWVVPAHERVAIDLFASETGYMLATLLDLLGENLHWEVRHRVLCEINRRIFEPFLSNHTSYSWYHGHHNWNGVCASSVAATFLLAEPDPRRAAQGVALALKSLQSFAKFAFESDGSSTEGVSYWRYGLSHFISLSEMLRARSAGQVDFLSEPRFQAVAAYPAKVQLSGSYFANFSDCDEQVQFHYGLLQRMYERTGEGSLWNLMAEPAEPTSGRWLMLMLREILWWNGTQPAAPQIYDAVLPASGVVRLVGQTSDGQPLVFAMKAGHNEEHHNQNDVGSFLVHVAGESLLVDPGRGLYNRFYFGPNRYQNIFASSYGHSVPRIAGQSQAFGRQYGGRLLSAEVEQPGKPVAIEFARAYPVQGLKSLVRSVRFETPDTLLLQDEFAFDGQAQDVEEALATYGEVSVDGNCAHIHGQAYSLILTIVEPVEASFSVERLEAACQANAKAQVLKRLTFKPQDKAVVRMQVRHQ